MILVILFITGPAQAFILGLNILDKDVSKGDNISFVASTEIEDTEFLNVSHFIFELKGPQNIVCSFNPEGKIIDDCIGVMIEKISSPPSIGYGYNFGKGNLTFNITLDTNFYSVGIYKPSLFIVLNAQTFGKKSDNIIIRGKVSLNQSCSIRGDNGDLFVEKFKFEKNKLSFYIPEGNFKKGAGSITSQGGRKRFAYDFSVNEIVENTKDKLVLSARGKYRIDRNKAVKEDILIFFDKKTKQIDIIGDKIIASNINAKFVYQCKF